MIITMTQKKGGAGKSTIAVSMAARLHQSGLNIGLLDCDPLQTSSLWSKRREQHNIAGEYRKKLETVSVFGDIRDTANAMAERNDHVIIDTPGFDSQELKYALGVSDLALAPFRPKQFDLETHAELVSLYHLMIPVNPKLQLVAVLNSVSTHPTSERAQVAHDFLMSKGIKCLPAMAYNRESWGDCTYDGRGVSEYTDKKAVEEITNIVREVLKYEGS